MRAFKTEGIILKRRDFGEADRIIIAFTLHRGKVAIIAKGVRRITSRRAGNVELLNRVAMFLYPGKQFLNLTEATSLDTFQKIKEDLTLSTYAYHIIELVDKLTAENQESPILYTNLVEVLKRLENNPRQILIRGFEARILSLMGFADFQINDSEIKVGPILEILERGSWNDIENLKINRAEALELENILRIQLEKVIEGPLKSRQFLKELKKE
jgi:recombinational DNA repair protein (RecF pathway)